MPHLPDRFGHPAARRVLAGAVLMLSLGMAAAGATAQTGTRPQPAQAQAPAGQKPAAAPQAQPARDPVEAHLADVRKKLNITPAQQSQFDQFANAVKQNAQSIESTMQKAQQNVEKSAVDSLRTAANFAETEAENLKRLVPAFETLYASLTAEQKRIADRLFNAPQGGAPGGSQGKRQR